MSVVGLDVGNYSCYVAVAAGGGIDTVANEYSDRCTPSYVSLNEKNRCMGQSAKNQSTTNVKNTISCFKRVLGRQFDDPQVQQEIKFYLKPFSVIEGKDGETLFEAYYMGELQHFTPEQVTAMLLTKLKEVAEKAMRTKVVDVVVSVPCFFTDMERRAMIASCQMAGLNCLKVMNDTTAVSLAYGIYKQDLPAETEKSRNVVFVDVGYCSLQVTLAAFNKGKLKVLAVQSDSNLGGRDFDKLLVDYFIEEFKKKYKIDVLSSSKAYIRLTQECEKLKKLMSANTQQIPLDIECFMNDKDVHGSMDRATFEQLAVPLLSRAEAVLKNILQISKISPDDVYAVEVVGGSSRLPCLKELVTKVFLKEPSTTLNSDEAVAKGCALQCAILSPTFRVRDFSILDCQQFPITLSWQGGGLEEDSHSSLEVFPQFHQIPFSKLLTFYRKEPFSLEARYSNPCQVPIKDSKIGTFYVTKVQPQANGESSKVKVKLRINSHGIFNVQSASMIEKIEKTAAEPMETENGKELEPSGTEATKTDSRETDQGPTTEKPNTENKEEEKKTAENGEANSDKKDEKEAKAADKEKKSKVTTKSIDLPIEPSLNMYTKEVISLMFEKENQMIMQDKLEKERVDAKNAVEEYVYDMRDKICGPLEKFAIEEARDNFSKLLAETEDWLYSEGEDQNKQVYLDKLSELKTFGDPISNRYKEALERPEAFDALGRSILHIRKFLDEVASQDDKYSHLEQADIDKVKKCLNEKAEWFEKQMNAQNKLKLYEDPAVLASQLLQTKQSLDSTCNPIINKPKPPPKEEPPKEKKDEMENKSTSDSKDEQKNENTADSVDAKNEIKIEKINGAAEMDVD